MSKRTEPADPDTLPSGDAPNPGTTTATCCPTYAGTPKWFGAAAKAKATRATGRGWTVNDIHFVPTDFGWDDRTNMPATSDRGTDEYWLRSGAPGTSGGKRDLDGSAWVSVGVGSAAKVEVVFVGQTSNACIQNVELEVEDTAICTAAPTSFTSSSAELRITGVAAGECTITLKCNGAPIGWCHAAVYTPKTANMSVFRVNLTSADGSTDLTSKTPFTAADMTRLKSTMDDAYGQCAVSWTVTNGGIVTYTTSDSVTAYNNSLKKNQEPSSAQKGRFFTDFAANNPAAAAAPALNLYYFEPLVFDTGVTGYGRTGGYADGIPSQACQIYAPPFGDWGRRLLPHELGHCLGLFHPNDGRSSPDQLPDNFRLPLVTGNKNCMVDDHINIMGYGVNAPPGTAFRYGQWKKVQSTLT